jgi:hypothetical protein
MAVLIGFMAILGTWQGADAGLFDCLKKRRVTRVNEEVRVEEAVRTLHCNPDWRKRDDAAHDLRAFDWREYPQITPALLEALRNDPHEEVREEAAQTLYRLAPCLEEVRFVLAGAARLDPDHATRKWAMKALDRIGDDCDRECDFCNESSSVGGDRFGPSGFDPSIRLPILPEGRSPASLPDAPAETIVEPGLFPAVPVPYLPDPGDPPVDDQLLELAPLPEIPPFPSVLSPFHGRISNPSPPTAAPAPDPVLLWSSSGHRKMS